MRAVRRFYFYIVSLIALEVVVWGVINLARRLFAALPRQGSTEALAAGLAMVLVGVPVFLLHWRVVQHDARRDDEERASYTRALFFYAALASLLVPVVLSILAILDRLFLAGLGIAPSRAFIGSEQTYVENLISIVVNLAAAFYFWRLLSVDWLADLPGSNLADVRRLYRYLWLVFSLVMLVSGAVNLLHGLIPGLSPGRGLVLLDLGNGLALVLVGAPLWYFHWQRIRRSLDSEAERLSRLRMVVLYLIAFSGVLMVFINAVNLLSTLLERLLGYNSTVLIYTLADTLSYIVPGAVLWFYFWRQLSLDLSQDPDAPGRASIRRLYFYLLALLGLGTLIWGLQQLLASLVDQFLGVHHTLLGSWKSQLASALAMILVALPVWLLAWRVVQREAARQDDEGDHARRSTLRKGYLYLVVFAALMGLMISAGRLVYLIVSEMLGNTAEDFITQSANLLLTALLFTVWFIYHLIVLRADNRTAQRSLGARHAAFPAVIIQAGNESFTVELVQAMQRLTPRLPIAVHRMDLGAPSEDLLSAKVVILPAWLAMQPGEALRLWLGEFQGPRILVPNSLEGWIWLGALPRTERDLARETAQAVRQLAEGQEVHLNPPVSIANRIGDSLALGFGLILLFIIVMSIAAALFGD